MPLLPWRKLSFFPMFDGNKLNNNYQLDSQGKKPLNGRRVLKVIKVRFDGSPHLIF